MRWLREFEKAERLEELAARFDAIPGWTPSLAGYALYCAAKFHEIPGEVVEIGAWKGRSTCWLAEAGKVTSIDTFDGGPMLKDEAGEGTLPAFQQNVSANGLSERVSVKVGKSQDHAKEWDKPIRVLFIDGDHSYEGAKADWESWRPFLSDGAVVFFDDVGGNYAGAKQFFDEQGFDPVLTVGNMKVIHVDSANP